MRDRIVPHRRLKRLSGAGNNSCDGSAEKGKGNSLR